MGMRSSIFQTKLLEIVQGKTLTSSKLGSLYYPKDYRLDKDDLVNFTEAL